MLFQTLDDKNECVAYYSDGGFSKQHTEAMTHSWTAPTYLQHLDIQYAYLYAQGTLNKVCPDHLKKELSECLDLLRAYSTSMIESKLDMDQHCFYDLVPVHFLKRFCEIKNRVSAYVFDEYEKPSNYTFLKELHELCQEISNRRLNLHFSGSIRLADLSKPSRSKLKSVKRAAPYVRYNIFGSRTGRLTTKPNSFPILNLNKEFRSAIKPTNDKFIELDYNAFELRVLLYLLNKDQPDMDIHEWNRKNVYKDIGTRAEAKTRIFAWLYNLDSSDRLSENAYNREEIIARYWDGQKVVNPFGRAIESDRFHAISYLVQSTAADIVLRQMNKIHKILKDKKSFVAFSVHDSIVLDVAEEDYSLVGQIFREFSDFEGTNFLASVAVGEDYGTLESAKGS